VESGKASFDAAILAHDEAVEACNIDIWVGAEPTFTNRGSEAPEWLSDALGETKLSYACHIVQRLGDSHPGSLILRTLGRQYADEDRARWSLGLYSRRDDHDLAAGLPNDPLTQPGPCDSKVFEAFWLGLTEALDRDGWAATGFQVDDALGMRVAFRSDGQKPEADPDQEPRLVRPSIHDHAIPLTGAVDDLAEEGLYLLALGCGPLGPDDSPQPCMELPAFADVPQFMDFLQRVADAAQQAGLSALVWRGFPPPVDASVALTTLTPDPAVVEINEAPASSAQEFLDMSRALFAMADAAGLSPYRLQYNGNLSDSGGGGQFTLGGPSPERSPFFVAPQLAPRLIRYLNRHPSLSYWFAPLYVGSFSQSPRPDENVRESFSELAVALQQLAETEKPEPEFIWRCLSPFLVDTSGNAHRSELNIEKLWNPYLPGRGRLGLVEFRAFRMATDPETATAVAALLRALAAMLSKKDVEPELVDWDRQLHDRFALPYYLRQDLAEVFRDLESAGLGLQAPITERLSYDDFRHLGHLDLGNCRLEVDQALEFWPLLGDAAMQEGGSRLVDASTTRLQLVLRSTSGEASDLEGWQILAGAYRVPLHDEMLEESRVRVMGLRYRSFVPWTGLHPGIGAQGPIVLTLVSPEAGRALRITLHEWQPQGEAYEGLPDSFEEAQRRIRERFVVEEIPLHEVPEAITPPVEAVTDLCLDLRRCL
jgi:uncharacterized protein (DUF2126 family)